MAGVARVIAGASGSPRSLPALRCARALASAHEVVLIPVLAWTPPGGDLPDRAQPSGYLRRVWSEMADQRLREALLAAWGYSPADPMIWPRAERGPAGWVLVGVACEPGDVLVLGAGRRGALRRLVHSRVSRYCVAHARCPVVLVPPPELGQRFGHAGVAREIRHSTLNIEDIIRDQDRPATG